MSRMLNFDNFMEEKKQDPIIVTVFGEQYAVKPEIPATVMVTLARAQDGKVASADAAIMIFRAGDVLFGKETIDHFCEKGITSEQLLLLIRSVFDTINGKDVDGDDVEEISDEDGMQTVGGKAKK